MGSCEYTYLMDNNRGRAGRWVREEVSSSPEKYFHISQQFCDVVELIGHDVTNT